MNWQEIERLLEKYYEGETSLQEEGELIRFFSGDDVPPHLAGLKPQFDFIGSEQAQTLDDPAFDGEVMSRVREKGLGRLINLKSPVLYWISGIAATILILVAVFVQFNPFGRTIADTYSNPAVAYDEARKVLLFVSDKLNQGTGKLEPVGKFNDGIQNLAIIDTYNEGMGKASSLGKFNEVIQINL